MGSSLRRLLQRHDSSRLPEIEGNKEPKKKFKAYPRGYFHIDRAEGRAQEGKSQFIDVALLEQDGKAKAAHFLCNLIKKTPESFPPHRHR